MQNYKYDFSIVVPIYNEIKNLSPLTDSIINPELFIATTK
ncbi:hypothetical protein SAMN05421834_13224 [Halanaerobium kushneri]|uniref:Glycosyl transferase family 2 n=1 Tax=Halanaerobium kushneri TaxID=56779 RepID=A0A1N7BLE3_9FIRM|nr:hypothetical protein SAMN05421834_13224 [Halanaerobium kushneri]